MSETASTAFEQLCEFNRETAVLESIGELLGWDERTMLPPAGGDFPTYALGNLYASQFFAQASADLGGLDDHFARGEFAPLRDWLGESIHRHGQCYTPSELVQRVTGEPLSHEPFLDYLRRKLEPLYGI